MRFVQKASMLYIHLTQQITVAGPEAVYRCCGCTTAPCVASTSMIDTHNFFAEYVRLPLMLFRSKLDTS